MNNVVARFIDKDNKIIKIEADEAIFNNRIIIQILIKILKLNIL